jgi:hypothetical protein
MYVEEHPGFSKAHNRKIEQKDELMKIKT